MSLPGRRDANLTARPLMADPTCAIRIPIRGRTRRTTLAGQRVGRRKSGGQQLDDNYIEGDSRPVAPDSHPRDSSEIYHGARSAWHQMWVRGSVSTVTHVEGVCLSLPPDLSTLRADPAPHASSAAICISRCTTATITRYLEQHCSQEDFVT
ncbi:hypothetical protein IQ06DRAFT_136713 [Phaeosphaeriaceae sp. SRC1lsM3a]|nr:hypothetical protein IQ06DRAFT_136713 [Stagonospora sp. SRC1lsM3a]